MSVPQAAQALIEIRLVGRGGQGVVTAGELMGEAALHSGRAAQAIPTFGPERRGALAQCTLRVAGEPIQLKCSTARPSLLVCLDPTIWRHAPVTLGLQEGAVLVFNSTACAAELERELREGAHPSRLALERCRVCALDATGIALEMLGRPISNTAMLGALVGAAGVVPLEALEQVLQQRFGAQGEANVRAARAGFAAVREGDA